MRKTAKYASSALCLALSTPLAAADKHSTVQVALSDSRDHHRTDTARDEQVLRLWDHLNEKKLKLKSTSALIVDKFDNPLYDKFSDNPMPIASITKLMTAMVVLDSGQSLDEKITISKEDRDLIRLTGSRLKYGATLTRREMLQLALMSSENRAALSLGRTYPGGKPALIKAMNAKAKQLGMHHSHFEDPAGLKAGNIASPRDLATMLRAAQQYPLIREATTSKQLTVRPYRRKGSLKYVNTNRLMRNKSWSIGLSKTGYINEAGRCLVMQTEIAGQNLLIILLNSYGKLTPFGDANRIRKWIEKGIESS
ncbi:MAG: D-alanyl-D-alanine endopeptidase [Chromatiales bacterium]|jgi:D-alanyl-D-alanine endopeptidase (penicillin-binding protein 7)